ncbi:hypothetical protein [Ktedonospora formicarum]|uniref:Capsid protein n=1 Tax=Ktedonospora formicarum TaxID=2778364 RepID=A0A8J3I0F0_9CHLR|nr:hypothetical protein [Ktedonospora formicarum]GHO44520.1 hypothetical protein KSX_26830 [Ktedonospora formicarum]
MLPTDEIVQKALTNTTTANLAPIIPQLWSAELEKNLRRNAIFEQLLVENTELLGTPGDTVYIPMLPDLADADDLTEGTDMNVIALNNATSVPIKPNEVGKAVSITRKALDRMKYDGMSEVLDRLAYSMSRKFQGTAAKLYTKAVPGTANKMAVMYPNGKTSTTVTTAETFSANTIIDAITQLKLLDNSPWEDGLWRMVISNYQYADLIKDSSVRQDLQYSAPKILLQGEVGIFRNCRLIVSNYADEVLEGSGNTTKVSVGYILAPRWAFVSWKRRPELVVDPTLYDFGRRRQMGVTADYAMELVHPERAIAIKTAHA